MLESMSSTMPRGGRRVGTRSIHCPERSASSKRFLSAASHCVSKRPIWLGDAAQLRDALPPTIQRIAGSWRRRSASFTSSRLALLFNALFVGALVAARYNPRILCRCPDHVLCPFGQAILHCSI